MTKNLHLEHPEDTILTGDLSVLNWFITPGNLSVKIDGSPAIVWGTNPENGKFFVGTKSVFNKKKIRIAHSHEEINAFYSGEVESILHVCFNNLPRTDSIIQGDYIGLGGARHYTPNTITYVFPERVDQVIIVAPHTEYSATNDLRDAVAKPLNRKLKTTDHILFLQPEAYIVHNQNAFYDVEEICNFARQMSTTCNFVQGKELAELKKQLNLCIREGLEIEDNAFNCEPNLIRLWKLVKSIKDDCLFLCRNDGPEAYIGDNIIDSEGYVMFNKYGMYKLVNREVFSHANFNAQKNWCK